VSAAAGTHPVIVFNYGSRPVANHEQGREIIFYKEQKLTEQNFVRQGIFLK